MILANSALSLYSVSHIQWQIQDLEMRGAEPNDMRKMDSAAICGQHSCPTLGGSGGMLPQEIWKKLGFPASGTF